jgi:hypothetical protein
MTTSQEKPFLYEILAGEPIPPAKLTYFRERFRGRVYDAVITEFIRQRDEKKLTQAELGRRINRTQDQMSRWLGAPGNWTLDTISDLMLAMGAELEFSVLPFAGRHRINYAAGAEWLNTLDWADRAQKPKPSNPIEAAFPGTGPAPKQDSDAREKHSAQLVSA